MDGSDSGCASRLGGWLGGWVGGWLIGRLQPNTVASLGLLIGWMDGWLVGILEPNFTCIFFFFILFSFFRSLAFTVSDSAR